jgi:hypothetical protein
VKELLGINLSHLIIISGFCPQILTSTPGFPFHSISSSHSIKLSPTSSSPHFFPLHICGLPCFSSRSFKTFPNTNILTLPPSLNDHILFRAHFRLARQPTIHSQHGEIFSQPIIKVLLFSLSQEYGREKLQVGELYKP